MDYTQKLPEELLGNKIINRLSNEDLRNAGGTSRRWRAAASKEYRRRETQIRAMKSEQDRLKEFLGNPIPVGATLQWRDENNSMVSGVVQNDFIYMGTSDALKNQHATTVLIGDGVLKGVVFETITPMYIIGYNINMLDRRVKLAPIFVSDSFKVRVAVFDRDAFAPIRISKIIVGDAEFDVETYNAQFKRLQTLLLGDTIAQFSKQLPETTKIIVNWYDRPPQMFSVVKDSTRTYVPYRFCHETTVQDDEGQNLSLSYCVYNDLDATVKQESYTLEYDAIKSIELYRLAKLA